MLHCIILVYVVSAIASTKGDNNAVPFTYRCLNGKVSSMNITQANAVKMRVKDTACKSAITDNTTLVSCLNTTNASVLIFESVQSRKLIGGNQTRLYNLSCTEGADNVNVPLQINVRPTAATEVKARPGTPTLTASPDSDLFVGMAITLKMTILGSYKLQPLMCKAYPDNKKKESDGVKIWEQCKVTEQAIISNTTWKESAPGNGEYGVEIKMFVFKFNTVSTDVYINCETTVCPDAEANSCNLTCSSRRKRNALLGNSSSTTTTKKKGVGLRLEVHDYLQPSSSATAMKMFAYEGDIFVSIAVPLIKR